MHGGWNEKVNETNAIDRLAANKTIGELKLEAHEFDSDVASALVKNEIVNRLVLFQQMQLHIHDMSVIVQLLLVQYSRENLV